MQTHNNVNNVSSLSENNNVTMLSNKDSKHRRAERIAVRLIEKLSNPEGREFYIRAGYKFSEAIVEQLIEIALTKRFPNRWFSWAASNIMNGRAFLINGRIVMADQIKND